MTLGIQKAPPSALKTRTSLKEKQQINLLHGLRLIRACSLSMAEPAHQKQCKSAQLLPAGAGAGTEQAQHRLGARHGQDCWERGRRSCLVNRGLTFHAGRHVPKGITTFLHIHQELFSWLNFFNNFIIDLGIRNKN